MVSYEGWNKPEAEYGLKIVHSSVICLKIPSEYEGKEIVYIDKYECEMCNRLRFLELEEGIERIGAIDESDINYCSERFVNGPFQGEPLIYVKFPNTMRVIPAYTFYKCTNLVKVSFPEIMEEGIIGANAFYMTGLRKLELPKGMNGIGRYAFAGNMHLRKVVLPDDMTYLPEGIFYGCNIKKIEGGENIRYVMDYVIGDRIDDTTLKHLKNVIAAYPSSRDMSATDLETELELVSEQSGISLELLQHPYDSNEIIIEGKYYTLPISLEKFLQTDAWDYNSEWLEEHGNACMEHKETGHKIIIYCNGEVIIGFEVSAEDDSCQVILPGGIVPGYTSVARFCTLNRIYNDNEYIDVSDKYGYGNKQGNLYIKIDDLKLDGTIKEIDIEIKQTKE